MKETSWREASWRRHLEEASWMRNHGADIMEEASGGGIMEEASWRRHHGGSIMGGIWEASGRHLGGSWELGWPWEARDKLGGKSVNYTSVA